MQPLKYIEKSVTFSLIFLFSWLNSPIFFVPHTTWLQVTRFNSSKSLLVYQWYSGSWHLGLKLRLTRYKYLVERIYHFPVPKVYVLVPFTILLAILWIPIHLEFSIEWVLTNFFCLWLTVLTQKTRRYHIKIHLWAIHIWQITEFSKKIKIISSMFDTSWMTILLLKSILGKENKIGCS